MGPPSVSDSCDADGNAPIAPTIFARAERRKRQRFAQQTAHDTLARQALEIEELQCQLQQARLGVQHQQQPPHVFDPITNGKQDQMLLPIMQRLCNLEQVLFHWQQNWYDQSLPHIVGEHESHVVFYY